MSPFSIFVPAYGKVTKINSEENIHKKAAQNEFISFLRVMIKIKRKEIESHESLYSTCHMTTETTSTSYNDRSNINII